MISFYNFNDLIRTKLNNLQIFLSEKYKNNQSIKLYQFFEELKLENYELYKTIIGLTFLDSYRLLLDRQKYHNTTSEEEEFISEFEQIEDIEDLMFVIEDNPKVLSSIILGSIKFKNLNLKGQANMLLQIPDEKALKFNKFYLFEKFEMFKERTKDDILSLYKNNQNLDDAEKIYDIFNIMDVLYIGNLKCFSKLLLEMLKIFYKWKKVVQITNPELTFGLEDEIIEIVETNNIDDIAYLLSYYPNLIEIIIIDFLRYETKPILEKKEIEILYNKLVSNEIKIKLKEV